MYGKRLGIGNKPVALLNYNKYARGVDRSNQFLAYYSFEHRSRKWWKYIFNSLIETSIANAWILYKSKNPLQCKDQLQFREGLVTELIERHVRQPTLGPVQRLIPGLHKIALGDQKNCSVCSSAKNRKTSKFCCVDCQKTMCIIPCYYNMHTKTTLFKKGKSKNRDNPENEL